MIIQAISYGEPPAQEFDFTYSGDYTDNRDENGVGTVTFNTSGTLTVLSGKATVSAYILAGGGGGACHTYYGYHAGGGGGGYQTVDVELVKGDIYDIVIGTGGSNKDITSGTARGGAGGDTTAFGYTCTGGSGGTAGYSSSSTSGGTGGTPNGGTGKSGSSGTSYGGSPNGGSARRTGKYPNGYFSESGGDGYVELTFS